MPKDSTKPKITGMKQIVTDSKNLCKGYYSGHYLQLFYDRKKGKCWSLYHYSIGHNELSTYPEEETIDCGIIYEPITMAEIVNRIEDKLKEISLIEKKLSKANKKNLAK